METVTEACVCLFTAQPSLADQVSHTLPRTMQTFCHSIIYGPIPFQVPPLGHIPRILARMKAENDAIPKACLQVTHILADSEVS